MAPYSIIEVFRSLWLDLISAPTSDVVCTDTISLVYGGE